ncbi:MAG: thiamine diphosphokinase [Meiothermus ruber]|jgi:thiamine pyrophosphokinase|uniref:Thiamine diphosphokinase n=1 Tax=Meiothermus ruber TaxID=277 RepID=A0A7C3DI66_MEIRU|nr:thiamine diphosphokinase [Meiothermus ruber]GIW32148.1 MAG: thiamine pyrophosphokinase [Meiothermus sp.]
MHRFTILLGGLVVPTERLRAQVAGSRIIAADGGMRHAQTLGLMPELWVGDFDSASPELEQAYVQVPREEHPVAKDFTDGELAVAAALARGAEQLVLVGAMGGQTDQTLAHLLLGIRLARQGIATLLTSGNEEAHPLLPGQLRLDLPPQSKLSLLPLGGFSGLSIRGVRWPLQKASVSLGSTQTLSNLALGPVEIDLEGGYGVVIVYPESA